MNSSAKAAERVDLRGFDWDLIRSFLAVIDAGSLLGAARRLSASQPTIGRHIDALETQLGTVLFERTGRGLTPTGGARLIAEHARLMQSGADQLARAVTGSAREQAGLVRITASRIVAQNILPAAVVALQAEAPDIDIAIVADDAVSNLLRRDADIAIRMVRPEQGSLIARKLGEYRIMPCASHHYLDRYGTPTKLGDLINHRLIGPDRDRMLLGQFWQQAGAFGVDLNALRLVVRSDDFVTQVAAIRAGLGVGFTTDHVVARYADLRAIRIDFPIPPLPVWLAVHREIRTNPRIRRVFDSLAGSLKASVLQAGLT